MRVLVCFVLSWPEMDISVRKNTGGVRRTDRAIASAPDGVYGRKLQRRGEKIFHVQALQNAWWRR
jgi:hypothetical protein